MYVFMFSKKLIHKVVILSPSCFDKIFWQIILSKTHFTFFFFLFSTRDIQFIMKRKHSKKKKCQTQQHKQEAYSLYFIYALVAGVFSGSTAGL